MTDDGDINARLDRLEANLTARIGEVETNLTARIDGLQAEMELRFGAMSHQVVQIATSLLRHLDEHRDGGD